MGTVDRPPPRRPDFCPLPPSDDDLNIPVVSPGPGETLKLIILGQTPIGVWTHYIDRRTRPCFGLGCECQQRRTEVPRRWKAYLGCYKLVPGRLVIACITGNAARSCPILTDYNARLRGWELSLYRRNAAVNSPVLAMVKQQPLSAGLPPAFDVKRQLFKIWGLDWWQDLSAEEEAAQEPPLPGEAEDPPMN